MKTILLLALVLQGCTINIPAPAPSSSPSPTPTSSPSPSPTPSVTPSPSPSPSVSPSPSPSPSASPSPAPSSSPVAYYNYQQVTTTTPSFTGATVGAYNDVLVPVSGPSAAVVDATPPPRAFPFYSELDFDAVSNAFGLADQGSTFNQRCQIYLQAISELQSFGIQPIKHEISTEPTDWSQYGACSYSNIVLSNNIYAPCVAGPQPGVAQNVTFLQMIEAGIKAGTVPAGAWIYLYDEPQPSQYADLISQAQVVRANAPDLKIMVTMQPVAAVAGYVDIYSPIDETYNSAVPQLMSYGSCTAQGSCTNGFQGTPTGTPMMVMDAPPVNWTAYPVVLAGIGAQMGLYYETTQQLSMAPGGEYYAGGNGDGTLLYAGTNFTVWPSARLLGIKNGLTKIAAMRAHGKPLSSLVTDAHHWDHTIGDYAP